MLKRHLVIASICYSLAGASIVMAAEGTLLALPILQAWSGDFPTAELARLPEGQHGTPCGYLGGASALAWVWEAFKPRERVPEVDFGRHLVDFVRDVAFCNRINIGGVVLQDGTADILAMETLSARPIEDRMGMALAVVPREALHSIRMGDTRIAV